MRVDGLGWARVGVVLLGAAVLAGCAGSLDSVGREGPRADVEGELAFVSPWQSEGTTEGHDIMVTGPDGNARYLTRSRATDSGPAWSPDGRQLAFTSDREGPSDIFVLRPEGQLDNLTASELRDAEPAWSPDGERIAFVRSEAEENGQSVRASDVWVMAADGSEPRNLTDEPATIDAHPSWSPDGKRLVFASTREGRVHLWVLEVDSGELHNLSEVSQPTLT